MQVYVSVVFYFSGIHQYYLMDEVVERLKIQVLFQKLKELLFYFLISYLDDVDRGKTVSSRLCYNRN